MITFPVNIDDLTDEQVEKSVDLLKAQVEKLLAGNHKVPQNKADELMAILRNEGKESIEADEENGIGAVDGVSPAPIRDVLLVAINLLNRFDQADIISPYGWRTAFGWGQ